MQAVKETKVNDDSCGHVRILIKVERCAIALESLNKLFYLMNMCLRQMDKNFAT